MVSNQLFGSQSNYAEIIPRKLETSLLGKSSTEGWRGKPKAAMNALESCLGFGELQLPLGDSEPSFCEKEPPGSQH